MSAMNKRKRESHDNAGGRAAPAVNQANTDFDNSYLQEDSMINSQMDFATALANSNANVNEDTDQQNLGQAQGQGQNTSDTAAAAIAQYHTMTVPQSTEQSFLAQTDKENAMVDQAGSGTQQNSGNFTDYEVPGTQSSPNGDSSMDFSKYSGSKPAVGSDEWHKVRRDNHKEVERRRRETINEGINELAKIVPGCEKNKGSILHRAVQFITQLKDNETQNIEKWTLEKLLTEQAIAELSSSCDKLKAECQRAWAECEQYKKAALKVGVVIDDKEADAEAEEAD